jgi:hypothetical protein
LAGDALRVQGRLLNLGSGNVIAQEGMYAGYEAKLVIKRDGDSQPNESAMNLRPSSYYVRMNLPIPGTYTFYLQLFNVGDGKTVVAESGQREVVVHRAITINKIEFADMPSRIGPDRGGTPFTVRARFVKDRAAGPASDDVYALYYNKYMAVAYVSLTDPEKAQEYMFAVIMGNDGASYFVEEPLLLPGSGVYYYHVVVWDGDTVVAEAGGSVTLVGPLWYIATAVFFAIGICAIAAGLVLSVKKQFGFIVTVCDGQGIKQLVFSSQVYCFCFLSRFGMPRLLDGATEHIVGKGDEDVVDSLRKRMAKNAVVLTASGGAFSLKANGGGIALVGGKELPKGGSVKLRVSGLGGDEEGPWSVAVLYVGEIKYAGDRV